VTAAWYYKMVKEKPNSIRTYDADGFRKRAACLCVRDETEQEVGTISCSSLFLLWPGRCDWAWWWQIMERFPVGGHWLCNVSSSAQT